MRTPYLLHHQSSHHCPSSPSLSSPHHCLPPFFHHPPPPTPLPPLQHIKTPDRHSRDGPTCQCKAYGKPEGKRPQQVEMGWMRKQGDRKGTGDMWQGQRQGVSGAPTFFSLILLILLTICNYPQVPPLPPPPEHEKHVPSRVFFVFGRSLTPPTQKTHQMGAFFMLGNEHTYRLPHLQNTKNVSRRVCCVLEP